MSGRWSGGVANRQWARPGVRTAGDPELATRLDEEMAAVRFWCDNCGRVHPLREHRTCRAENPFQTAYRG